MRDNVDKVLLIVTIILLLTGAVMIYSSTALISLAAKKNITSFYYFKRHIFTMVIGFFFMYLAYIMDQERLIKLSLPILIFSFLLLLAVFIPKIGITVGGARRWIRFWPSTFQPSELVKIAMVIFLARYVSTPYFRKDSFISFIIPISIMAVFQMIFLLQPDFGATINLGLLTLTILLIAGTRLRYVMFLSILAIPVIIKLALEPYRRQRILAFLDPWSDPQGSGFQLIQSFIALGSGGLKGVGLGEGKQKLSFLPEIHTDFIFSLIGEELGFLGAVAIVAMFLIIFIRGISIAGRIERGFGYYLSYGLTMMIVLQAIINFSVATGMVPTKGLPLPFISYGGSSLLVNMIAIGLLLNLSKKNEKPLKVKDVSEILIEKKKALLAVYGRNLKNGIRDWGFGKREKGFGIGYPFHFPNSETRTPIYSDDRRQMTEMTELPGMRASVLKIIIAGGGTGGHLFPGIAIADEILRRDESAEVTFVGTEQGIERTLVPQAGYNIRFLKAEGIVGKSMIKKIKAVFKVILSIMNSYRIINELKPDVIIGVGGYASFGTVLTGRLLSIPTMITEQNSIPGLANRILGGFVNAICITYHESLSFFPKEKTYITGNPIRQRITRGERDKAYDLFSLDRSRFTILVFGGSRGATRINRAICDAFNYLGDLRDKIQFLHQTGRSDIEWVKESYRKWGFKGTLIPFIYDMAEAYAVSDLIISRAGATTLAEITAIGRPSILIPYPFAAASHQEENARKLAEIGGAIMILDEDLNGEVLSKEIKNLSSNNEMRREMQNSAMSIGRPDAAKQVVDIMLSLIKKNRGFGNRE